MKRITSFILVIMMISSLFVGTSITAFAEGEQAPSNEVQSRLTFDDLWKAIAGIKLNDMNTIKAAYDTLVGVLKGYFDHYVAIIKGNPTYTKIAKIVITILGIILFPIVIALILIAYITIGAMILFAGALTAVVELVLGIVSTLVPI